MPSIQISLNPYLIIGIIAVSALLFVSIGLTLWAHERASDMLDKWAQRNQYQIEKRERRSFFKGPFFWTTGRGQYVYRVIVRDDRGQERVAWVKLGSWIFGIWQEQVQVIWEDSARI